MPNNDEILQVCDERDFWFAIVDICVWEDETLSTVEKAVYTALCTFASSDRRRCFPSVSAIAKRASCSSRAVYAALAALSERGYVARNSRYKGKEQIASDYSLLGHKSAKRGAPDAGGGVNVVQHPLHEVQTEPEPRSVNNTLPTVEAGKAPAVNEDEKNENTESKSERLCQGPAVPDENGVRAIASRRCIPEPMRATVEFFIYKTSNTEISEADVLALRELSARHTPARVQKEISTAVERFERLNRDVCTLTFDYIWQALKNQPSTLKAAFRPKNSPPKKAAELSKEEQAYQDELMKKWGGETDVGKQQNAVGPGQV